SFFGSSVEVSRIAETVVFAAGAGAVFVLSRRLAGARSAAGAAVLFCSYRIWAFPHWHVAHYSTFSALFLLLALLVLTGGRPRVDSTPAREAAPGRPAVRLVTLGRRSRSGMGSRLTRKRIFLAGCLVAAAIWY